MHLHYCIHPHSCIQVCQIQHSNIIVSDTKIFIADFKHFYFGYKNYYFGYNFFHCGYQFLYRLQITVNLTIVHFYMSDSNLKSHIMSMSSISYPNTLVLDTKFFIMDARGTIQELMQYQMQAVPTIESILPTLHKYNICCIIATIFVAETRCRYKIIIQIIKISWMHFYLV